MADWTLGFIGSGVMAESMMTGVVSKGLLAPDRVLASDPHSARRELVQAAWGVRTTGSNLEVLQEADLVVLAVKPQSLGDVFAELRGQVPARVQLLSVVAGASLWALRRGLEHERVARAMPNLPCRVHRGMTVWTGAEGDDAERVRAVLRSVGEEIRVENEVDVDRATAVNGTGPAIVAEFVKAMMEAATYIGQPRELAREAVLATLLGTAEMVRRSDTHVAQLIDEVTSPGGTTSRALQVLKQGGFAAVITDSVDAAYRRTQELGADLNNRLAHQLDRA